MTDAQPPTERETLILDIAQIIVPTNGIDTTGDARLSYLRSDDCGNLLRAATRIADYILARERQAFVNGYARAAKDAIEKWETVT